MSFVSPPWQPAWHPQPQPMPLPPQQIVTKWADNPHPSDSSEEQLRQAEIRLKNAQAEQLELENARKKLELKRLENLDTPHSGESC